MNIEEIRQEYMKEGYTRANAIAKVCQDIIPIDKVLEDILTFIQSY